MQLSYETRPYDPMVIVVRKNTLFANYW